MYEGNAVLARGRKVNESIDSDWMVDARVAQFLAVEAVFLYGLLVEDGWVNAIAQ